MGAGDNAKGNTTGLARLRAWAVNPAEGGKVFRWSEPGAFSRCQVFYRGKVPGHMLDGWCSNLYALANGGRRPGQQRGDKG